MRTTHLIRIVLCGLVAGIVWYALSAFLLSVFAQDLLAFVRKGGPYPMMGGAFFFGIDLLMGVWVVWLYSVLAPKYGAGLKSSTIAGVVWWIIKSLQSAKWAGLGFIPHGIIVVPLATTLVAAVLSSMVGAWLYQRGESDSVTSSSP